tara:strand:- start:69 stop:1226 length:1158 start_codon:yes stop_codon:yes gene_type:complete
MKMKIYQGYSNGSEAWVLDAREDGKRTRRYFKTRQKAQQALLDSEAEMERHDEIFQRYKFLERMQMSLAHERCKDIGGTLDEAVNLLQIRFESESSGNMTELMSECIADKEAEGMRPRSVNQLRCRLSNFRDEINESRVGRITPKMIKRHIQSKDWACATRNGYLADIKSFFSWLLYNEHIKESPAHKIKRFKKTYEEEQAEEAAWKNLPPVLSPEQVKRLFKYAHDPITGDSGLIPFMALIFFGGLRPEREAPSITRSDIDLDEKLIHVRGRTTKDRQSRYLELNPTLEAWLNLGGELPAPSPYDLRNRWAAIRKACNLYGDSWPHDAARHTYASNYLATHSAEETIKQLGHGNYEMLFKHYRTLVKPSSAKEFWEITPWSDLK